MQHKLMPFILKLTLLTALLCGIYYWLENAIPPRFHFSHTWFLFLFFYLITTIFHAGLTISAAKNNKGFVNFYMLGTAFKLFLFLGIIIIYALLHRDRAVAFISTFFVLYLFYTVFEVGVAYKTFSRNDIREIEKEE